MCLRGDGQIRNRFLELKFLFMEIAITKFYKIRKNKSKTIIQNHIHAGF